MRTIDADAMKAEVKSLDAERTTLHIKVQWWIC